MSSLTPEQLQDYKANSNDNRQGELYATAVATLLLAWLFVGLRFVARWNIQAGWKKDDWLIVASAAVFTAYPVGMFVLISVGFGRHIIYVTDPQKMVQTVVMCEVAYSITIPLTKLSILSLYNRIFPSRNLVRISIGISIITVLYSVALAVVCILQCVPLSTLWGTSGGWCMNTIPPYTVTAVANVITDIAVLCLPMPFLYRLNMRVGRKLQLMGLFALGGCVCVFGIVRSIEVGTASPVDQSWSTVNGCIWSAVEPCVGIISACLPTMRGLIRRNGETHTGYTDYERSGPSLSRFGWTAGRRPRSVHSSVALGRNSSKPQVWSTVTSGLQSSPDRSKVEPDIEEHPFAKLDSDGRGSRTAQYEEGTAASSMSGMRRKSINDIHVRTEMTQEVSQVEGETA